MRQHASLAIEKLSREHRKNPTKDFYSKSGKHNTFFNAKEFSSFELAHTTRNRSFVQMPHCIVCCYC